MCFTNEELFKGASTTLGAIAANPRFVSEQTYRNIRSLIVIVADLTAVSRVSSWLRRPFAGYFALVIVMAVTYGAVRLARDGATVVFVVGSILLVIATVFVLPKARYMPPFIPILVLAATFYGTRARRAFGASEGDRSGGPTAGGGVRPLFARVAIPLCLVLFSNGATRWLNLIGAVAGDARQGTVTGLESRTVSMKRAFPLLDARVQGCKGVLSFEHTFVGAFLNVPLDRVYDIWEIPPFGRLGDSGYRGLRPDRIDCVLVSDELATSVTMGTNNQIRYQNYIKPYVEQLKTLGATTYEIPRFGTAIILPKSS